jgi:hypothetical protein
MELYLTHHRRSCSDVEIESKTVVNLGPSDVLWGHSIGSNTTGFVKTHSPLGA